jgi:hypothetical protein
MLSGEQPIMTVTGRVYMYFSPSLRRQRANSASVPIRATGTFVPLKPWEIRPE